MKSLRAAIRRVRARLSAHLLEMRGGPIDVKAVTVHNTRSAYERLYSSPDLHQEYLAPHRLRFYDEVAAACREQPFASVLDAGCGSGELLDAVARQVGSGVRLAGFDYAQAAIARARELMPNAEWTVGSIYEPPVVGPFDLVVCAEVLEHLSQPERALVALAALRAPAGRILITVPDGEWDRWPGHVNFWSAAELARLLEPFGAVDIRRIDEDRTLLAVVSEPPPRTGS